MAELFVTAIDVPPRRPSAPSDSFLSPDMPARVFNKSTLEIAVEVKDSFSSVVLLIRRDGRRILVNDTSRWRRPGDISRKLLTT
jgi:hypothetical protein